ncbi:MAG: 23S rRNA (guanosine(2251)-2'-O)-methyltransferase RlmB [Coxiellaceae bacterium]|jgi:23S rRNA (guanosine2251-2'-O)-methyltransferase|nr:23S rRNA (guanosine(2251)-2'-O)-methyltransferase RlmB [Coxiellaceae bacterium]
MIQPKYIFGFHTVKSALSVMPGEIHEIYLQGKQCDKRNQEIIRITREQRIPIRYLSKKEICSITNSADHQGIAAKVIYPNNFNEKYLKIILDKHKSDVFLLILDGVQDPHNLGACLRTANAFGVHALIIPKYKVCSLTPTVYKVASGAVGITPIIHVTNLARTIQFLKKNNVWIYGAIENAEQSICNIDLKPPLALIFGGESDGLRRLTKENCDLLFKIPMCGIIPNLNVSVSVGIGLFEVRKRCSF